MTSRLSFVILCGICLFPQGLTFQLEDTLNYFDCFNTSLCDDGPRHQKLKSCENILTPEDEHEKVTYIREKFFPGNYDDIDGLVDAFCNVADDKKPEAYINIERGILGDLKRNRDDPAHKDRFNRLYSSAVDCFFKQTCGSPM